MFLSVVTTSRFSGIGGCVDGGGQASGAMASRISAIEPAKLLRNFKRQRKRRKTVCHQRNNERAKDGVAVAGYQTARWAERAEETELSAFSTPSVSFRQGRTSNFTSSPVRRRLISPSQHPPTLDEPAANAHTELLRDGATHWRRSTVHTGPQYRHPGRRRTLRQTHRRHPYTEVFITYTRMIIFEAIKTSFASHVGWWK